MDTNPRNPESAEAIAGKILALSDGEARKTLLDQSCAGDPELRGTVERLLAAYGASARLRSGPALPESVGPEDSPGHRIGRYKLLQKIGEGGMGAVYLAEQEEPVRRRVALKLVKLGMDTKSVVARFEAERQALALMDHPNIAKVLDGGATETGRPYFVMELVQGLPITEYCDRQQLAAAARLRLFVPVCQAVQHAHQKGIIHRDLKPSNVLVTLHDGAPVPKVIDFGIAKAINQRLTEKTLFTHYATMIGTPAYMSPEQAEANGLDVDTRSDIYSLGVLLYELLTGTTPFPEKLLRDLAYAEMQRVILEEEPQKPSTRVSTLKHAERSTIVRNRGSEGAAYARLLQGDLDWVVVKCLEKDRNRRYATANGLAADLRRHLDHEPVEARPPSAGYRLRKAIRRNRKTVGTVCAIGIALILGTAVSTWMAVSEHRAHRTAESARAAEARQRRLAEDAQRTADELAASERNARHEAQAMARRNLDLATQLRVEKADTLIASDRYWEGVRLLAQTARENPQSAAAADRLLSALTWQVPAVPVTMPLRHGHYLKMARFSPDGRRVATASEDKTARIWDASAGTPVTEPLLHASQVDSVLFAPDGQRLLTTSWDGVAVLWNVDTGRRERSFPASHRPIRSTEFGPGGSTILTAVHGGSAILWNATTGDRMATFGTSGEGETLARFVPGRPWIAILSGESVRLFAVDTPQRVLADLPSPGSKPKSFDFSADGRQMLTTSDQPRLDLWDLSEAVRDSGKARKTLPSPSVPLGAQFDPEGERILTWSTDGVARVWHHRRTQSKPVELRQPDLAFAAFGDRGRFVATASMNNQCSVWDSRTGERSCQPLVHDGGIVHVEFRESEPILLTASLDGTARLWTLPNPARPSHRLVEKAGPLRWAEFDPPGTRAVLVHGNQKVTLHDLHTNGGSPVDLPHPSPVHSARFDPDGTSLVTASEDGSARIWNTSTGREVGRPLGHRHPIRYAEFDPSGERILTFGDTYTTVWDWRTASRVFEPARHGWLVVAAHFSPTGDRVVDGTHDGTARVWNARTGEPVTPRIQLGLGLLDPVREIRFSPDGRKLVAASGNGIATVLDAETGNVVAGPLRHRGVIRDACFSPDGLRVATASEDATARVWDALTGMPVTDILRHGGAVRRLAFSPDGRRLITASEDATARIWDAFDGLPREEPFRHRRRVAFASFAKDGARILTASDDGSAAVWRAASRPIPLPEWLLELVDWLARVDASHVDSSPSAVPRSSRAWRERVSGLPESDPYARWARWFLSDRFATPEASPPPP